MSVRVTSGPRRKTCVDGSVIIEFSIVPPPDNILIESLMKKGQIFVNVVGGLSFFRIEWIPEVMIKGLIGDPVLIVTCRNKDTTSVKEYIEQVFS
jgi:hypothetical protein